MNKERSKSPKYKIKWITHIQKKKRNGSNDMNENTLKKESEKSKNLQKKELT